MGRSTKKEAELTVGNVAGLLAKGNSSTIAASQMGEEYKLSSKRNSKNHREENGFERLRPWGDQYCTAENGEKTTRNSWTGDAKRIAQKLIKWRCCMWKTNNFTSWISCWFLKQQSSKKKLVCAKFLVLRTQNWYLPLKVCGYFFSNFAQLYKLVYVWLSRK